MEKTFTRAKRALADQQFAGGFQAIHLGKAQELTISASSGMSAEITSSVVRLCADTACRVAIGKEPTATVTGTLLPANTPQLFGVNPGEKVAVIGTSGKLSITEAL